MKPLLFTPLLLALLTLLTGCSPFADSEETRFYALSALAASPQPSVSNARQLRLGIGPVRLPRLLKHPQMITRKTPYEINLSETHQWGGSLKEDVTHVIADNIARLLATKKIEQFPWKQRFKPDYQIRIKIQQLDGALGGTATLKARWWLRVANAGTDQLAEHSHYTVTVDGNDYASYVAALSQLLEKLSVEIAQHIQAEQ